MCASGWAFAGNCRASIQGPICLRSEHPIHSIQWTYYFTQQRSHFFHLWQQIFIPLMAEEQGFLVDSCQYLALQNAINGLYRHPHTSVHKIPFYCCPPIYASSQLSLPSESPQNLTWCIPFLQELVTVGLWWENFLHSQCKACQLTVMMPFTNLVSNFFSQVTWTSQRTQLNSNSTATLQIFWMASGFRYNTYL
jgi:hypothetical protein